jgi:hypothetical protein
VFSSHRHADEFGDMMGHLAGLVKLYHGAPKLSTPSTNWWMADPTWQRRAPKAIALGMTTFLPDMGVNPDEPII